MFQTYKPTGRIGFFCWPLLILVLVATLPLAFAYQYALKWIPLIYINFLVTYGVSFSLGFVADKVVTKGRCRNILAAAIFGILITTTFLTAKFVIQYQVLLSEIAAAIAEENRIADSEIPEIRKEVSSRISFWQHIQMRVDEGWNIQRRGQNMPMNGFMVYLVWAVEAGLLLYFPITKGIRAAGQPFNESKNEWASEAQVAMVLPVNDAEMVSKIQSAQSVDELLQIPIPKSDETNRFAVYTVNSIPGMEFEDAYLTVVDLNITTNQKGEPVRSEKILIKHAILSSNQRRILLDNASLLQEAIAEFRQAKNKEMLDANVAEQEKPQS